MTFTNLCDYSFPVESSWKICPGQSIQYTLINWNLNFDAARVFCESLSPGAHLATPRNPQQSECVHKTRMEGNVLLSAWIGLEKLPRNSPGNFHFIDYDEGLRNYNNWTTGQPDGANEHCVAVWTDDSGKVGWDDTSCNRAIKSICQRHLDKGKYITK